MYTAYVPVPRFDADRAHRGTAVLDEPATAFALARHLAAARACGPVVATAPDAVGGIDDNVVVRYLVRRRAG